MKTAHAAVVVAAVHLDGDGDDNNDDDDDEEMEEGNEEGVELERK